MLTFLYWFNIGLKVQWWTLSDRWLISYSVCLCSCLTKDWPSFHLLVQLFSWQSPSTYRQASGTQPKHLLNCYQYMLFFHSQILEQLSSYHSVISSVLVMEFAMINLLHHLILLLPCGLLLDNLRSHSTIVLCPCPMATLECSSWLDKISGILLPLL